MINSGEFHIHTIASDGSLDVNEVLNYVSGKRKYIAITDHDILTSSLEAYHLNGKYDVTSIIGVEISSFFNDETVHILGYFKCDKNFEEIINLLQSIRDNRINRLYKMCKKLKKYFDIDLNLVDLLKTPTISRGSIAREIIKQYPQYTIEELFDKVIGEDCIAYIPSTKISTQLAIEVIHRAKGLAVLAHPTLLKKNDYRKILDLGCDGIEAVYPRNQVGDEQIYRNEAKKRNIFVTGGADFHYFKDKKHADLLTYGIDGNDLEIFIQKVRELERD